MSALAELAKDGAKGILTSRPNYFSESEELNVFEALYRKLDQQKYHLSKADTDIILHEKAVDNLIERYVLGRYERVLQDLTPEQTESLVRRSLEKNPQGQNLVISILNKVFREESSGNRQALSGKPVIIAYLLELVAELQRDSEDISTDKLTEWQIYKLIVDRLMMRDFSRSPLSPTERRRTLQELALRISARGVLVASEVTFMEIIDKRFGQELRRLSPEERRTRRVELFEDLRSSATLTRAAGAREDGWIFSHNSLREFLVVEIFLDGLLSRDPLSIDIPVSEAMRSFVSSMRNERILEAWRVLGELWAKRATDDRVGGYLVLLWDSALHLECGHEEALSLLGSIEENLPLNAITVKNIDFSVLGNNVRIINGSGSTFSEVRFDGMNLSGSNFEGAIADTVSFRDADLSNANFEYCLLFECDLSGATVRDANFQHLDLDSNITIVGSNGELTQLTGKAAIGYLRYNGARTSAIEDIFVYAHHPKFSILEKICEKVSEQRNSQLRGLTQRGEARVDPPFARDLVDKLVSLGWMTIDRNDLVSATPNGRPFLQKLVSGESIAAELVEFLINY